MLNVIKIVQGSHCGEEASFLLIRTHTLEKIREISELGTGAGFHDPDRS